MSGSASHEVCSEAGASLRCEEFDGGSKKNCEVDYRYTTMDNYGYIVVDGVRDRSWRESKYETKATDRFVSMSGCEGGGDHLPAGRGVKKSCFVVIVHVMEDFECLALFDIERVLSGVTWWYTSQSRRRRRTRRATRLGCVPKMSPTTHPFCWCCTPFVCQRCTWLGLL